MSESYLKLIDAWRAKQDAINAKEIAIFDSKVQNLLCNYTPESLAGRIIELEIMVETLRNALSYSKSNEVPEYNMRNN